MKCDGALLSAYLDNELKAVERTELEVHVTNCVDCAGQLEKYRRLRFDIRDEPLHRPPAQLRSSIQSRIYQRRQQWGLRWAGLAVGAPLAIFGVLAGSALVAPRSESSPQLAVTATSPMTGARRVAPNDAVELWFDRELASSSPVAVTVDPPVPVHVAVEGNALRIEPDGAFEAGQTYTVAVESVVDVDGRRLKNPAVVSFVTAPPALAASSGELGSPRGVPSESGATTAEAAKPQLSDVSLSAIASVPAPVAGANVDTVGLTAQTSKWPTSRSTSVQPVAEPSPASMLVGEALGGLQAPYQRIRVQEQAFQGGVMVRLGDSPNTLVLQRGKGTWESFTQPPSMSADSQPDTSLPPPPGALSPSGSFAAVWKSAPSVRTALGWAVYEPRVSSALVQLREHGTVVTLGRMAYLLRSNGTWNVVLVSKTVTTAN
jgi:anti-sigma factor RsiW